MATETVNAHQFAEELKAIRKDLEFIKEHMVDVDTILTQKEEWRLNEAIEEYKAGKQFNEILLQILTKEKEHIFEAYAKQTNLQKNRHLFDRWAKSYDNAVFQFWMKKFHAPANAGLQLTSKTKVLDISRGTGELLKRLQGRHNFTEIYQKRCLP